MQIEIQCTLCICIVNDVYLMLSTNLELNRIEYDPSKIRKALFSKKRRQHFWILP